MRVKCYCTATVDYISDMEVMKHRNLFFLFVRADDIGNFRTFLLKKTVNPYWKLIKVSTTFASHTNIYLYDGGRKYQIPLA